MDIAARHRDLLGRLGALARKDLGADALLETASALLVQAFPGDLVFFAGIDPETRALQRFYQAPPLPSLHTRVYINEYFETDFNQFTTLARQAVPVGILDEVTDHNKNASVRHRELTRGQLGMDHEMRGVFRMGRKVSGVVSLLRPGQRPEYVAGEARFLASFAAGLEPALQRAWLKSLAGTDAPASVGQILLDRSLGLEAANPAGERWRAELGADWEPLVQSLAALVRMRGSDPEGPLGPYSPRVRMTTRQGRWVTVHASLLTGPGGEERLSLIIEGAGAHQLQGLWWEAYGLTDREQDVFRCVLRGDDTRDIAAELGISPYTVQDFLKSIFAKTGVRSRRDLVAKSLFR